MKYKIILITSIFLLIIISTLAAALTYSELNSNQKKFYQDCMNKDKCYEIYSKYWNCIKNQNCEASYTIQQRNLYTDCSKNCFAQAANYNPSTIFCFDTDGINYLTKGKVISAFYSNWQEDYCYIFGEGTPQQQKLLFEFACANNEHLVYQKDCKEMGLNYDCVNGACIINNNLPQMNALGSKEMKEGQTLTFTVNAKDIDGGVLTYQAEGLPQGAQFNTATGAFSFAQNYNFVLHPSVQNVVLLKFRVSDGKAYSPWIESLLTVKDVNQVPALTPIGKKQAKEGETLSFFITATDADSEDKLFSGYHAYWCPNFISESNFGTCVFGEQNYPGGVSFNKITGEFKWDTSAAPTGSYGIEFHAYDMFAGIDSEKVMITINNVVVLPVYGCTDPLAKNYNPLATQDDDSCVYEGVLKEHHTLIKVSLVNVDRMYLIYEPYSCKTKSCPLLFMFHGLGGKAQDAADNYGWKETADKNEFIAAFPESLTLPEKSFGNYIDPAGKHWDITPMFFVKTQDTNFVEKMITEIDAAYDIDNTKVFAAGHSYGGYFSYYAAFVLPEKIKAFGTHSAGLQKYNFGVNLYWPAYPLAAAQVGNKPGVIIYSDDDNTGPNNIGPKIYAPLLKDALTATGHSAEVHKLIGFGHNWDKAHNQEQWDFFKKW